MDIVRRNTDYALRAMVHLARHYGNGHRSTRIIAREEEISYQLACKLLQKLHDVGLVKSAMGPRGGFQLSRPPEEVHILEIIETIQGPMRLNRCLLDADTCSRSPACPVHRKFASLQEQMVTFMKSTSLADVCQRMRRGGRGVRRGAGMSGGERTPKVLEACVGQAQSLAGLVDYSDDAIVSKTILDKQAGTLTLFAFGAGQGLSEHTAPYDAVVEVLDGRGVFTIDGDDVDVSAGELVIMPGNVPHSVRAVERFKMLLTMIRA